MLNINAGHNSDLMKNCEGLDAYAVFVGRVRANIKNGMEKGAAVEEALDFAIKQKLLGGYFKEKKSEVKAMSIFEFDQEEYGRHQYRYGLAEGIEQGREEGREEGIEQERENMVISFDRQGVPVETIAAAAKMTVEQVKKIIEKATVTA